MPQNWQLTVYGRSNLDVTNHSAVRNAVQRFRPDIIINCAGMVSVENAESNQDEAISVNFEATANLAAQCSTLDIPLIYLSSDYVFDGRQNTPYRPNDAMNPLNIYGQTKLMGEEAIRQELPWHVILRTSLVFSAAGKNVLTETINLIEERDEIKIADDMICCPTHAGDVAEALIVIADALIKGKSGGFGTFHLCGTPACSRFEFAKAIMANYSPHTTKRPILLPVSISELTGQAPCPKYSVLDCSTTKSVYGIEQRPWSDMLATSIQQIVSARMLC